VRKRSTPETEARVVSLNGEWYAEYLNPILADGTLAYVVITFEDRWNFNLMLNVKIWIKLTSSNTCTVVRRANGKKFVTI
jgi:hypothetical protein